MDENDTIQEPSSSDESIEDYVEEYSSEEDEEEDGENNSDESHEDEEKSEDQSLDQQFALLALNISEGDISCKGKLLDTNSEFSLWQEYQGRFNWRKAGSNIESSDNAKSSMVGLVEYMKKETNPPVTKRHGNFNLPEERRQPLKRFDLPRSLKPIKENESPDSKLVEAAKELSTHLHCLRKDRPANLQNCCLNFLNAGGGNHFDLTLKVN